MKNYREDFLRELEKLSGHDIEPAILLMMAELESLQSLTTPEMRYRWQDKVILNEIPTGSYVLDLGCGRGELLSQLIKEKNVHGQGVELDPEAAMSAMDNGVPVLNVDVTEVLDDFDSQSFDYVILESTLQTLKAPLVVMSEILRVGRRGIVSFPNFGHWRVRLDLAVRGRMPVTPGLPHGWYDTPNIHLLTLADFMDWCYQSQVQAKPAFVLTEGKIRPLEETDNLTAEEVLMFLEKSR